MPYFWVSNAGSVVCSWVVVVSSMMSISSIVLGCLTALAQQSPGPAIVAPSYALTSPFNVAPGQLITLVVQGIVLNPNSDTQILRATPGGDLPTTLGGVSVQFFQTGPISAPMLELHPYWTCPESDADLFRVTCSPLTALTIQIPFEAQSQLPIGARGVPAATVSVRQTQTAPFADADVGPLADQVHIITSCDAFMDSDSFAPQSVTGLPCLPIVAHADGSTVSVANPAKAGEELIAYAVGLGQTNPGSVTGQLVTQSTPTITTFTLDFNFHPNALASRPPPNGPQPSYAGTTPGYVGLYQVNFMVPQAPAGTSPCVDASKLPAGSNVVQSNLTVSIGGQYSFDGARICVATQ